VKVNQAKVIIRHGTAGVYYAGENSFTSDFSNAFDFKTIESARDFLQKQPDVPLEILQIKGDKLYNELGQLINALTNRTLHQFRFGTKNRKPPSSD
jgi:hypothetical protein